MTFLLNTLQNCSEKEFNRKNYPKRFQSAELDGVTPGTN